VRAKIYYDTTTGAVLLVTPEMQGYVSTTTKEQDMLIYAEIKGKSTYAIDYIELPYGSMAATFANATSWSVDINTKKLKLTY